MKNTIAISVNDNITIIDKTNAEFIFTQLQEFLKIIPDVTGTDDMDDYICSHCKEPIESIECIDFIGKDNYKFCSHCGYKFNWKKAY